QRQVRGAWLPGQAVGAAGVRRTGGGNRWRGTDAELVAGAGRWRQRPRLPGGGGLAAEEARCEMIFQWAASVLTDLSPRCVDSAPFGDHPWTATGTASADSFDGARQHSCPRIRPIDA